MADVCSRLSVSLEKNPAALAYLTKTRGFSRFTIDDLLIGYCDWNTYEQCGINLHGRIVFPIKDLSGDVIGFSGRILGEGSPKYINSAASLVYDKSRVLYNLDVASDYILSSGKAIVVEGCMDIAALWDSGIRNVVAPCGTSFTKWHLRLLKRYADEIYLVNDDDKAGIASTERSMAIAEVERFPVYPVSGLIGMDPEEYVKIMGSEAFTELLNAAKQEKKKR
jgi:DNA primase